MWSFLLFLFSTEFGIEIEIPAKRRTYQTLIPKMEIFYPAKKSQQEVLFDIVEGFDSNLVANVTRPSEFEKIFHKIKDKKEFKLFAVSQFAQRLKRQKLPFLKFSSSFEELNAFEITSDQGVIELILKDSHRIRSIEEFEKFCLVFGKHFDISSNSSVSGSVFHIHASESKNLEMKKFKILQLLIATEVANFRSSLFVYPQTVGLGTSDPFKRNVLRLIDVQSHHIEMRLVRGLLSSARVIEKYFNDSDFEKFALDVIQKKMKNRFKIEEKNSKFFLLLPFLQNLNLFSEYESLRKKALSELTQKEKEVLLYLYHTHNVFFPNFGSRCAI